MTPIMRPMCCFRFHRSYHYFLVNIKLARLIFATNIKLPHIRYEAQLFLIVESIDLNYQTFNKSVQYIIGTCGISICRVCSVRNHYLENTSSNILVNAGLQSDGGDIFGGFLP